MTSFENTEEDLHAKLNRETSRMPWTQLLRHFAGGTVVAVSADLDLVEVAVRFSRDDKDAVAQWMSEGRVALVSDAQAAQWLEAEAILWAVVVKPWILVQEKN